MVEMNYAPPIRRPLEGEHFHVIVIGGGINGVAIARECARAGRRTLLVEQHDFAAGTTSRATRIIHGGLRYLEHGEIGLVRESSGRTPAPAAASARTWCIPTFSAGPRSEQRPQRPGHTHRSVAVSSPGRGQAAAGSSREDERKLERLLDSGRRWSIFSYEDAQCEFPERLVAEWLVEAIEAGAVARNHTQVLAVDVRHRRVAGVLLRDQLSGKEERVEGHMDHQRHRSLGGPALPALPQIQTPHPMVGGVRGSHIVMPRFRGRSRCGGLHRSLGQASDICHSVE